MTEPERVLLRRVRELQLTVNEMRTTIYSLEPSAEGLSRLRRADLETRLAGALHQDQLREQRRLARD